MEDEDDFQAQELEVKQVRVQNQHHGLDQEMYAPMPEQETPQVRQQLLLAPMPKKPIHVNPDEIDNTQDLGCYASCQDCCGNCAGKLRQYVPCCCCCQYPMYQIEQSQEGLLLKFGKYARTLQPNLHFINPWTESLILVDKKVQSLDLYKQTVLTNDNITATVDASVNYRITQNNLAKFTIDDEVNAVRLFTYTALRVVCGQMKLQQIIENKTRVKSDIMRQVSEVQHQWGVGIEEVFIKDIIVHGPLQNALASASQEKREAEAKVISAQADVQTAKMVRQAADSLDTTAAMQIRYLETLEKVCASQGTKVVFYPRQYQGEAMRRQLN